VLVNIKLNDLMTTYRAMLNCWQKISYFITYHLQFFFLDNLILSARAKITAAAIEISYIVHWPMVIYMPFISKMGFLSRHHAHGCLAMRDNVSPTRTNCTNDLNK
jgi:hypothetical protein